MPAAIKIRPAHASDRDAVGRLGAMLVAEHHDFDAARFIAPVPDMAARYGQFLIDRQQQPGMVVVVAERESAVVGYAFAGMEGDDFMALRGPAGVIYDLVVDPGHQRQGIGSALMTAVLDELTALGAPRAILFTADKNDVAQAIFTATGFRRTMIEMTRELGAEDRET
ncbi:MAG: GNAT family N-acetyltransferase [Sphingomicrobium sp.]